MVIKALLEGSINGVGKFHRTSIFPKSTIGEIKQGELSETGVEVEYSRK